MGGYFVVKVIAAGHAVSAAEGYSRGQVASAVVPTGQDVTSFVSIGFQGERRPCASAQRAGIVVAHPRRDAVLGDPHRSSAVPGQPMEAPVWFFGQPPQSMHCIFTTVRWSDSAILDPSGGSGPPNGPARSCERPGSRRRALEPQGPVET